MSRKKDKPKLRTKDKSRTTRPKDIGVVENFFKRDGRLNRLRYFKRMILIGVIESLLLGVIIVMNVNALFEMSPNGMIAFKAASIVGLIPIFCLTVRRLHDIDKDESLAYVFCALNVATTISIDEKFLTAEPSMLMNLASSVSAVIGLYLLLCSGTEGDNKYGSDPLAT